MSLSEPRESLLGGSDGEEAHRRLAHDDDGGRRRGALVRGRTSGGNLELKRCRCTPGRSGAGRGRNGAGRWEHGEADCR
jgi:hypothetical protein